MTIENISLSISMKVWGRAGINLTCNRFCYRAQQNLVHFYSLGKKKNIELFLRPFFLNTDATGPFFFIFLLRQKTDMRTFFLQTCNDIF